MAASVSSQAGAPEPPSDLHGDADAVRARLDAIGEPTLLVGHSCGA
ncbi:MAG TPA: hypothetical protein VF468_02920 [Actinomycetota bacterium]|nr:hypothetical protein [Actinomycetota bacterium]